MSDQSPPFPFPFKYGEKESIEAFSNFDMERFLLGPQMLTEFEEYLMSTYSGHYNQRNDDKQTIDVIFDLGFAKGFCGANIYKYLDRFGNKDGFNEVDIFKIMHYCLFLLHAARRHKENEAIETNG